MSDRSGRLFTIVRGRVAHRGPRCPCCASADAGWPQAAPPPRSACSRPPSNRAGSARAAASRAAASAARGKFGPDQRNRQADREIKIAAASAEEPGEAIDDLNARTKDAGDSLSQLAKPSMMVSGRAACRGGRQRRARLQGRRRPAVPEQGPQGRQEPRHRDQREMLAESVPAGLQAPAGRLQDRKLRDEGAVPVARLPKAGEGHAQTHRRQRQNAILDTGKIALLVWYDI